MTKNRTVNEGLLTYDWFRVILDEAHCIKNPVTISSRACCMLKAERRWCVTGTPIQNSLQDAFGLIKFLRHEPWCESGFWKTAITKVSTSKKDNNDDENRDGLQSALERVRRVLAPLILRRSKDTLNNKGEPILTLPPMEVKIVEVHLSTAEREFYNALKSKSQSIFDGIVKQGSFTKAYFQIFALINRLRQACDHVALTVKSHVEDWSPSEIDTMEACSTSKKQPRSVAQQDGINDQFIQNLLEKFQSNQSSADSTTENLNGEFCSQVANKLSQAVMSGKDEVDDECAICLEVPKILDAVITPCAHVFCRECLVKIMRAAKPASPTLPDGECPCCKAKIEAKGIISIYEQGGKTETRFLVTASPRGKTDTSKDQTDQAARQTLENALRGAGSAKLTAILDELEKIWDVDPGSKVLIFSQFLGFLDLLQLALRKRNVPYGRLDGRLTLAERKHVVVDFKNESDDGKRGSVLLLSMKAGGVGLNLVQASSVFIIDPWWNSAIEDQCIMRCHRIGQTAKMVRVRKFVVQGSVEEHIISLQERKKSMVGQVLSDNTGETLENGNKVTLQDFKILFGDYN
jgi:DNA repair protein RAD5